MLNAMTRCKVVFTDNLSLYGFVANESATELDVLGDDGSTYQLQKHAVRYVVTGGPEEAEEYEEDDGDDGDEDDDDPDDPPPPGIESIWWVMRPSRSKEDDVA